MNNNDHYHLGNRTMDLIDLHVFRTVVSAGGITRAAEQLHRVQSNVTTRIRQLEEDLGVQLFIREGKRMHVSPAGRTLLGYADRLLDLAREAREAVHQDHPSGLLRLGAMESTAAVRLPGPLSEYHRRFPAVTLELRTGNPGQLAAAILEGEIDAAFAAEPIADAPFEKVPVFDEELVIIAPAEHQIAARRARRHHPSVRGRLSAPPTPGGVVCAYRREPRPPRRDVVLSRHARLRDRRHGRIPAAQERARRLPRAQTPQRAQPISRP
jgi:DNA-binding transcriptional LysR family regulator